MYKFKREGWIWDQTNKFGVRTLDKSKIMGVTNLEMKLKLSTLCNDCFALIKRRKYFDTN